MSDKYDDLKPVVKNYEAPVRKEIRRSLMDVSDFTLKEISVLGWSSLYKAHSLIVKFGQKDVEEYFRSKDWFKEAVASVSDEKIKEFDLEKGFKISEEDIKRMENEKKSKEKLRNLKKEYKNADINLTDFTDLLKNMLKNPEFYSVGTVDDNFVEISKNNELIASFMLYKNSLYFKKEK